MNATERVEQMCKEFREDTGMMAPCKDQAMAAGGPSHDTRQKAWDLWMKGRKRGNDHYCSQAILQSLEAVYIRMERCGWAKQQETIANAIAEVTGEDGAVIIDRLDDFIAKAKE